MRRYHLLVIWFIHKHETLKNGSLLGYDSQSETDVDNGNQSQ